jgi:hypothetical protein
MPNEFIVFSAVTNFAAEENARRSRAERNMIPHAKSAKVAKVELQRLRPSREATPQPNEQAMDFFNH